MDDNIYVESFALRLSNLRQIRNITARDMSISLGQSHNFINNIEQGKNFPSMLNFFYICEFLNITAADFFEYGNKQPEQMHQVIENLKRLKADEFDNIASVIADLSNKT